MACGDGSSSPDAGIDAPLSAESFNGLWLMTSLTIPGEDGPLTLRRDGTPQSLRGDVVFTATGVASGSLSVRQVPLNQGVLEEDVSHLLAQVAVEPTRWLITEPEGTVAVFATTGAGGHLELAVDPTDPRHTSAGAPLKIVLDRAAPWGTTTVGAWDLVTMQLPDRTVVADACTALPEQEQWAKITMRIRFSDRLLFYREMHTSVYSDDTCTSVVSSSTSVQSGYVEHEGSTLRIWGLENGRAEYQAFTLVISGNATLTRTACLPAPACESTAPRVVVVRRG